MGITHLAGGLGKNITDIVKGGGCPHPYNPLKGYNRLQYFSLKSVYSSTYATAMSGVVHDGGYVNFMPTEVFGSDRYYVRDNGHDGRDLPTSPPYTGEGGLVNFSAVGNFPYTLNAGELGVPNTHENFCDNYLNITNQIEVVEMPVKYSGPLSETLSHITEDSYIEKDVDGYYTYYLFRPNFSMDITPKNTGIEVNKTGNLMEFAVLKQHFLKCQYGQIYLEINDFVLTNQSDLYDVCFNISVNNEALTNWTSFSRYDYGVAHSLADDGDLISTNNNNYPVKIIRSNQFGDGTNKKIVIWLNIDKVKGEDFWVYMTIGMRPSELMQTRYMQYPNPADGDSTYIASNCHIPSTDCIFKFKSANFKIKKNADPVDCLPVFWPTAGFRNIHLITAPTLGSKFIGGCGRLDIQNVWATFPPVNLIGGVEPISLRESQLKIGQVPGYAPRYYWADMLLKVNDDLKDETYKLRLPRFSNCTRYSYDNVTYPAAPYQPSSETYVLRVYAAPVAHPSYFKEDWEGRAVLLGTYTLSELGVSYNDNLEQAVGSVYFEYGQGLTDLSSARVVDIDGGLVTSCTVDTGVEDRFIILVLMKSGYGMLDRFTEEDAGASPVYHYAELFTHSEYSMSNYNPDTASNNEIRNLGCMLYQAPQIIDKTEESLEENYYI